MIATGIIRLRIFVIYIINTTEMNAMNNIMNISSDVAGII